jgi:gamma-glutamylputrescine oxidase
MMHNLHQLALSLGIQYYGGVEVQKITELAQQAAVHTPAGSFLAFQVVVATNGFAKSLLNIQDLHPARAQVLVTHPIPNLHIKGTFHFDQGYYYFRNIDQRILFGGGRNLDIKAKPPPSKDFTRPFNNI